MYPRRFKSNHRPIDWPRLINAIRDAGWTQLEIGEAIGMKNPGHIGMIARETREHMKAWDDAFALIELFLKVTDTGTEAPTIPRLFSDDGKTEKAIRNIQSSD